MSVEFAKKVIDMLSESERQSIINELLKTPKVKVKKVILTDQQARAIIYKTFEKRKTQMR